MNQGSSVLEAEAVFCACGCGEQTNGTRLEARRLRAEGWKNVEIAELMGVHPGTVKMWLRTQPARILKGHYQKKPGMVAWSCERCGGQGWATPKVGQPLPKFCQRRECLAAHVPIWGAIKRTVDRSRAMREAGLTDWFRQRRTRQTIRANRRERKTAEGRARYARLVAAFGEDQVERLRESLAAAPPELRELVATQRVDKVNLRDARLDAPFASFDGRKSLIDFLPAGFKPRGTATADFDPVGEAVAAADGWFGEVHPLDARFPVLARQVAVLPAEFRRRCMADELLLYLDENGPRFLRRATGRVDLLPWDTIPDARLGFNAWESAA